MVDKITSDDTRDERLARRLKRRNVSIQQSSRNSCRRNAKKNAEREDCDMLNDEYMNYINNLSEFMDDSDGDDGAKFVDNEHHDNNNGVSQCKWSDEDVDPDYKKFLQHLVKDGKSYVLEVSLINVTKLFIKYEEEDQLSDGRQSSLENVQKRQNTGATRILRSASRNKKIENPEKLGDVLENERNSLGDLNSSSREIKENLFSGNAAKESQVPVLEKEVSVDCVKPITHRLNGKSNNVTGTGSLRSIEHPCKSGSDLESEIDEDYKTFLTDFLYEDDQRLVYTPVDGRSRVYEEDNESTSDPEVVMIDSDPRKPSCTSIATKSFRTTMDVDSGKYLQCPASYNRSGFRERLMQILKRPYDPDEYKFFFEEANCHRAHRGSKNLRSGAKEYPKDSFAKSYLELYDELAMKINLVGCDRLRALNLLRGFFYWLQNLSHEGAFKPWMDPSCLNVLPQL